MRILLDTNVLFSALLWDGNERALVETMIFQRHTIVITDLIREEIKRTVAQKTTGRIRKLATIILQRLEKSRSVVCKTVAEYHKNLQESLRLVNKKDAPILAAGLLPDVDAMVSGDKGFIQNPKLRYLRKKKLYTTKELLELLSRDARE